jgi:hypothetical protein
LSKYVVPCKIMRRCAVTKVTISLTALVARRHTEHTAVYALALMGTDCFSQRENSNKTGNEGVT